MAHLMLPTEIKIAIVSYIGATADLLNIALCNTTFLDIARKPLYRSVVLRMNRPRDIKLTIRWCQALLTESNVARHVRRIELLKSHWIRDENLFMAAVCRLVIHTLRRTIHLQTLYITVPWHIRSWFLDTFDFPDLEVFGSRHGRHGVPTSFLVRHPTLREVRLNRRGFEDWDSRGLLPNLTCYEGPLPPIEHLHTAIKLSRMTLKFSGTKESEGVERTIAKYGGSLRTLVLVPSGGWKWARVERIAKIAPKLKSMTVNNATSINGANPGDLWRPSIATALLGFASLKTLKITGLFRLSPPDADSWIIDLHQACPSLRSISIADDTLPWYYHELKKIWMAPPGLEPWWTAVGLPSNLGEADYEVLSVRLNNTS